MTLRSDRNDLCSRRHWLVGSAYSLGIPALASLLRDDRLLADEPEKPDLEPKVFDLRVKAPPRPARAKAMISLFMIGGPSHIDLFERKSTVEKYDGKAYPGDLQYDNAAQASSRIMKSPWKFKRYGRSGLEMSELLPGIGSIADEICLVRSMHTPVNNHVPAMWALNTGKGVPGRPSLGSWLTYGLGSETRDLPAFVALTSPHGLPLVAGDNWSSGWLPSIYQGTMIRPREPRIPFLDPPNDMRGEPQRRQLNLLRELNLRHAESRPGETDLDARIANYELAARMQIAAKEALDISNESRATRALYGVDDPITADYGTRCLIARRLIERGVRFVQVWNHGQSWDHHHAIGTALPDRVREVDRPSAALVLDLKSRGLLDTTVVHWGGEMGRLPVVQNDPTGKNVGRDHNTFGFSTWFAGGGFKAGTGFGATDDFGYKAVVNPVSHIDYQKTLLHLFGFDADKLVYRRNNQRLTLTDGVPGRVVNELLA